MQALKLLQIIVHECYDNSCVNVEFKFEKSYNSAVQNFLLQIELYMGDKWIGLCGGDNHGHLNTG